MVIQNLIARKVDLLEVIVLHEIMAVEIIILENDFLFKTSEVNVRDQDIFLGLKKKLLVFNRVYYDEKIGMGIDMVTKVVI